MRSRLQCLTLVLCLVLLLWPAAAQPVRGDCGLNNNGFEGGFSSRSGDGQVNVGKGWEYWFQSGPGQEDGHNWRPSYVGEVSSYLGGRNVHSGGHSQKLGNRWAAHNAGLYQRVAVPRGSLVTFSAWTLIWSSSGDNNKVCQTPGNYRVMVGIDPTGGTNWAAGSVRWSAAQSGCVTWLQSTVQATAEADAVTVFLRGQCDFPVPHNESVWDDACLSVVKPTPRPTNTPRPTSTPTVTPTPTATPTPVLVDVCIQSFEDRNGNGTRDEGEDLIPGAKVTLLDAQGATAGDALTSGLEPSCFKSVPAGNYTVRAESPAGYEATGPAERSVTLDASGPASVALGYRRFPTSTPQPTATSAPTPTPTPAPTNAVTAVGRGIFAVSGVLVLLVAVALFVGPRYLRMV